MTKEGDNQRLDFGAGKKAESKAISVFDFLSDNSNIEWGAVGYGKGENNQNSVATSGSFDSEGNASDIARRNSADGNLNYYYHSHSLSPGSGSVPYCTCAK